MAKPENSACGQRRFDGLRKNLFEKIGGFSTQYVYGHYEDADLSLRWAENIGPVAVHPQIRLIHLEGQGSKVRGQEFRGAAIANRYFFSAQFGELFAEDRPMLPQPDAGHRSGQRLTRH